MNRISELMRGIDTTHGLDAYTKEIFRRLLTVADESSLTKEERFTYDSWLKCAMDNRMVLDAEIAEGRAQGLAEGRAEGKAEGRAESAREIAAKLKAQGIPSETISACTGLDADTIDTL